MADFNNQIDESQIPTKELLKARRKKAYEQSKLERKEKKRQEKCEKQEKRALEQKNKDLELWQSLKKATELDERKADKNSEIKS